MKNVNTTDVLGGIALVGMLAYALLYGMDATVSSMLTGLFGVLLGRNMRPSGGVGNDLNRTHRNAD